MIGVDMTPEMIAKAQENAGKRRVAAGVASITVTARKPV